MATISLISITDFGARGDGVTDNQSAIQSAFDFAASNHLGVYIPTGTFAHSGTITANGISVSGGGASSILKGLDPGNDSLVVTGSGGTVTNLQINNAATSRLPYYQSFAIWANGAQNYAVQNVLINGSAGGGILNLGATNGSILNNTVENTLADSISEQSGSSYLTIQGNRILDSGDDGISVVSYEGSPIVHDITIRGNTIIGNHWGRGIGLLGGNNIQILGNHIEGGAADLAGIYISSESEWATLGVDNVMVSGNTLIDAGGSWDGSGQGAVTLYNSRGTSYSLSNITITGNQIVDPRSRGFLFFGNGPEKATVQNNVVYGASTLVDYGDSLAAINFASSNLSLVASAYTTPLVPAGGGTDTGNNQPFTPPPVTPAPLPVTTGTGSDSLVLSISEDAYQGDALFTVSVDGKQLAGIFTTTASHAAAANQNFTFKGDWAAGAHAVSVNFINDLYGGTAVTDRNLYVNGISYDGTATGQSRSLNGSGPQGFSVTDRSAIPIPAIGSGSDALVLKVSEDAYQGDAQFTVSVDGKQLGGTLTATASHTAGQDQILTFRGDFGAGSHAVTVNFLNDLWVANVGDRNLYVDGITYGGTATGQTGQLLGTGPMAFAVSGGTTPSVAETGDHGALTKNLSQTGSYAVGGDTFVLTSGNAASVTLGTGTSVIKFIGASAVTLTAGSGQATVTADAGSNKFVAGTGTLDVTGGGGRDAYVFHANGGLLKIEDFARAKGDTLTVDKALQGSMVQASDGQGGTMLTFGAGATHRVDIRGLAAMPVSNVHWA